MSELSNEPARPTGSVCELCAGSGMVDIIPKGGGAPDAVTDECPLCLRQQFDRDWPDPGQYEHTCTRCRRTFCGGKGRAFCRKCQSPNDAADALNAIEQQPGSAVYGIIDPDYGRVFTIARLLAWQDGYALAMHGSFTRDLDLVAVPWTDKACEPEHLVRRIISACAETLEQHGNPGTKPHGRKVWTLIFYAFGDPRFVDLSVYPPNKELGTKTPPK